MENSDINIERKGNIAKWKLALISIGSFICGIGLGILLYYPIDWIIRVVSNFIKYGYLY